MSDIHGAPVSLASLWSQGQPLVSFLRHFGWSTVVIGSLGWSDTKTN
ncbi:MAG: hypothetical protein IPK19_29705 [Chloroflexi bacterium]|nr:hypothetical protein [Chloroflexota bacterium]